MSAATVGWVLDKDTSQRRLHVEAPAPGVVRVTTEVYGQQANVVELDAEGVGILQGLLGQALERVQTAQF